MMASQLRGMLSNRFGGIPMVTRPMQFQQQSSRRLCCVPSLCFCCKVIWAGWLRWPNHHLSPSIFKPSLQNAATVYCFFVPSKSSAYTSLEKVKPLCRCGQNALCDTGMHFYCMLSDYFFLTGILSSDYHLKTNMPLNGSMPIWDSGPVVSLSYSYTQSYSEEVHVEGHNAYTTFWFDQFTIIYLEILH